MKKILYVIFIISIFMFFNNSVNAKSIETSSEDKDNTNIKLLVQPEDIYGELNEIVSFKVEASGTNLKYQWEYSRDGIRWEKVYFEGYNTNKLKVEVREYRYNYKYRVKISDLNKNEVISESAQLKPPMIRIVTQPTDAQTYGNGPAFFEVQASGAKLKYQWEYSRDGIRWEKVYFEGYNTNKLKVEVREYRYNYKYRVRISDLNKNEVISESAQLKPPMIRIVTQPTNAQTFSNRPAFFEVQASGAKLKHQWEYSKDGIKWEKVYFEGYNTNKLKVEALDYRFNYLYRVVITDAFGNKEISESVQMKKVDIIQQPVSQYILLNNYASFNIEVSNNENISYSWEYRKNENSKWEKVYFEGHLTNTLKFNVSSNRIGYEFRCVISDFYGNILISDVAKISESNMKIVSQPYMESFNNEQASIMLFAEGDDLKYQWQFSVNGYEWNNIYFEGYNTNNIKFLTDEKRKNYFFRCKVSDKYKNIIYSEPYKLEENNIQNLVFENSYSLDFKKLNNFTTIRDNNYLMSNYNSDGYLNDEISKISYKTNIQCKLEDILMLRFIINSEKKFSIVDVSINNKDYFQYSINTQKQEIRVPITGYENIQSLEIIVKDSDQKIFISNIELLKYDGNLSNTKLPFGYFNRESYKETKIDIEENVIGSNKSMASVIKNNYLYSIGGGRLSVFDISDPTLPILHSSLDNLGDTRDIALLNDNILVITARGNGAFFIDISNPSSLKKVAHYDTLEQVSGLFIYGNYVFFCDRYFGIEVVDATNILDLKNVAVIANENASEYIDCVVSNGYLYVGVWGQKRVDIYDVRDLGNIVKTSSINVDGNAHGLTIKDNILFVATGFHSRNNYKTALSPGFGLGNGVEIYSIDNPSQPKLLSSTKIEGRYYYSGNDIWKVYCSENYLYFSSTYNGVYIYDIRDISSPKLVEHILVNISNTSSSYKKPAQGNYVFPYNTDEYMTTPILGICTYKDFMFLSGSISNLFVIQSKYAENLVEDKSIKELQDAGKNHTLNTDFIISNEYYTYTNNSSIYAITSINENYYAVASGSKGIVILDKKLHEVTSYYTDSIVKDIKYFNDYIYCAEGEKGLGIYRFENGKINLISRTNSDISKRNITSIQLTGDGKYILCQAGWTSIVVFDVTDVNNPVQLLRNETGSMYYRNIATNKLADGTIGVVGNTYSYWYNIDENGQLNTKKLNNPYHVETNGSTLLKDYVLTITNNGYVYYNPMEITNDEIKSLHVNKDSKIKLVGKPIAHNNILIICTEYNGNITFVDINDIDNPKFIKQIKIADNCDLPIIDGGDIIIPLRNSGIIKFSMNEII